MTRRVVVANEYDLERNISRHREGSYARHLLFGVQTLQPPQWSVRFVGESRPGPLGSGRPRILMTNLRGLLVGGRGDVVYATSTFSAVLAGVARALVGRPGRLVTIVHGVPGGLLRSPRAFALLFRGHDALLFLSPSLHTRLAPALHPRQQALFAPWGPSTQWLGDPAAVPTARGGFALVVGKSKRDWATLIEAHRLRPFPLVVLGGPDCPVQTGPSVTVHAPRPGQREALSLEQVRELYRTASVVVLPLVEDHSLNGLTALGEALASGAPTVMTATSVMSGFADVHAGWITAVGVGDAPDLADAVHAALHSGPPAGAPDLPTAEAFEALLHGVLWPGMRV